MEKVEEDLNLSFLLDHEREMILKVLQKDEKLRKQEEKRIRKMKNELLEIKHKGFPRPQESGDRLCARCLKTLGLIFDRGELCEECQQRVCSECRALTANSRKWRCNVCAKVLELKVVSGEWFLEERSKRFEQKVMSSDVIKHTILTSPPSAEKKAPEKPPVSPNPEKHGKSKPGRSAIRNIVDGAKKKGRMKADKKGGRSNLKPEDRVDGASAKSASDGESHSSGSVGSAQSTYSNRSAAVAVESSGLPTVPNNLRSQTPTKSSTPSETRRVRPDGAESVSSVQSGDSLPEKKASGHHRKSSGTPAISVSRVSLSSDRSHSEMDLSAFGSEPSDDALTQAGFSDEDVEEDIDALVPSYSPSPKLYLSSAVSTSSTPASERRWGYLSVPDSDAETSSINSMTSMYSETGDYGNARVSGEILMNISYSYKTGALNVLVKECHNLATGDERKQRTDAYVKTYLLPDKSRQSKRKTSIKANTINPVFNENLRYVISHSQLELRTLQVSVWHHDRFGYNSFLGEVELSFDSWEFDSQIEEWYALQPRVDGSTDSTMHYKGELTVVLKYIPAEINTTPPPDQVQVKKGFLKGKKTSSFTLPKGGMVELLVKGAKNLTAVKAGGYSDPFVKGYLLPDSNKSTKHKTAVERRTVNPHWNHTFTYCGLQPGDLNNICLELTVWDKEALASNVFLGGVRLGAGTGNSYGNEVDWMDSYGEEQRVWQRMIETPGVPHECTLLLRSSMRKRNT
uniref:Synaptotagmin-like protein 5 n=1 Tax=Oryzias latipes TaxID=8090 RepID=A0A3P9JW61_ORYLA